MRSVVGVAIVVALALAGLASSRHDRAGASPARVANPTVTLATGGQGRAAGGLRFDVNPYGYREREYFFDGTAKPYPPVSPQPRRTAVG